MIGAPSIFKLTLIVPALTRLLPTFNDLFRFHFVYCSEKVSELINHPVVCRVVYYESLKRELKTKTIYGFRCDEKLKN